MPCFHAHPHETWSGHHVMDMRCTVKTDAESTRTRTPLRCTRLQSSPGDPPATEPIGSGPEAAAAPSIERRTLPTTLPDKARSPHELHGAPTRLSSPGCSSGRWRSGSYCFLPNERKVGSQCTGCISLCRTGRRVAPHTCRCARGRRHVDCRPSCSACSTIDHTEAIAAGLHGLQRQWHTLHTSSGCGRCASRRAHLPTLTASPLHRFRRRCRARHRHQHVPCAFSAAPAISTARG